MAQILKQVLGCTIISNNGQTWATFVQSLPGYDALVKEKARVRKAQRAQAQAKHQPAKRQQVASQSKARPSVSQNRPQSQMKKVVKEGEQKTIVIKGDAHMYAQLGWNIIDRKVTRCASVKDFPHIKAPTPPTMSSAEQERRRQEMIKRNRQEQNKPTKVLVAQGSLNRVERVERMGRGRLA